MDRLESLGLTLVLAVLLAGCGAQSTTLGAQRAADTAQSGSTDASGIILSRSAGGASTAVDTTGPFFQNLGSNGRECSSCHRPEDGWSVTPVDVRARFDASEGTDTIFRPVDGATSPLADVSTVAARRVAYSMLLDKGVIRVGLPIPAGAEFTLDAVDDPYGYASASELSLFRRPPPATNLRFDSAVMWDGRETLPGQTIIDDLRDQANGAVLGHAQAGQGLTDEVRNQIVDFEASLVTGQVFDEDAGDLQAHGGNGGPDALLDQPFYLGINDPLGGDPTGKAFSPDVFDLYAGWANSPSKGKNAGRAAVVRGEALFNEKPIQITGVAGLNDKTGQAVIVGTCSTCHDTPNVGGHSAEGYLDIGIADGARRTPDMPLYTLRNLATGELTQTTDPGRALVTGKWADIGKFKGPILRGLAARPPYFHNGSAATLDDVVAFYDQRFAIGFSAAERSDLAAFLRAL